MPCSTHIRVNIRVMHTTQTAYLKFFILCFVNIFGPLKNNKTHYICIPMHVCTHISISLPHFEWCTFYLHFWYLLMCIYFYIFVHLCVAVYSIFLFCHLVCWFLFYICIVLFSILMSILYFYCSFLIISFNDFEFCLLFCTCVKT